MLQIYLKKIKNFIVMSYIEECIKLDHTLSSVPYILRNTETLTIGKNTKIDIPAKYNGYDFNTI